MCLWSSSSVSRPRRCLLPRHFPRHLHYRFPYNLTLPSYLPPYLTTLPCHLTLPPYFALPSFDRPPPPPPLSDLSEPPPTPPLQVTEACLPGGSLNPPRKALSPLIGTLGGVIGPIAVYLLVLLVQFVRTPLPIRRHVWPSLALACSLADPRMMAQYRM